MPNKPWLILLLMFVIGCSSGQMPTSHSQVSKARVIQVQPNRKYKLEAIFSGSDIEVGNRMVPVIEQLVMKSSQTGQEIKYNRPDGPSASDAHAYFTEVWSPDDEFVVLPLERFSGFCIIRAAEAIDMIQKQRCSDTVKVSIEKGAALWHEFERWDGDDSFIFKAGLSNDMTRFKYDISQGRLTALGSNFRFFEGQTTKGKVKINHSPD
jgi:hypothetical protein